MSHSFHTYLQHFFTRLPIRIGRSKLREQIDISLFLLKTDILQVKPFVSQFNKDIYSGFCVAKRSCITVSILLNCEQICNTHHQLVIPVRSHLCLDQMSWPGMEMSVLTTVILLLIRSQTSQLLCFCCALMRPASAHDEVRLVNVWSVAHVCEKYQQNCLKILADFKSLKKKRITGHIISHNDTRFLLYV